MNLGHLLLRRQQFSEAADHYEQALTVKPSLAEAHVGLARALIALNQPQQAESELHEALRLKPNLKTAQETLAKLRQPTTSTAPTSENNSATE
jgi:Tfp pilus assembly protein PilF